LTVPAAAEEPNLSVGKEEPKMRSIPLILAAFAFSAPAVAQSWEEYTYPEYAISVAFPASPKIESTTYQIADGRSVPARVYSVRQDKGEFKLTVADLANTGLDEKTVVDHAVTAGCCTCRWRLRLKAS
jgi:hypothetical protein